MALTWQYLNAPLIILVFAAVVRWGWKIDKGLSDSVANAALLRAQLEAHEKIDDLRFDDTSRRLDHLERLS